MTHISPPRRRCRRPPGASAALSGAPGRRPGRLLGAVPRGAAGAATRAGHQRHPRGPSAVEDIVQSAEVGNSRPGRNKRSLAEMREQFVPPLRRHAERLGRLHGQVIEGRPHDAAQSRRRHPARFTPPAVPIGDPGLVLRHREPERRALGVTTHRPGFPGMDHAAAQPADPLQRAGHVGHGEVRRRCRVARPGAPARGSRSPARRRGFDARGPAAGRAPRDGRQAALPRSGAPARGHPRGTRSATTSRRAPAQRYRSIEQNLRTSTAVKAVGAATSRGPRAGGGPAPQARRGR